MALIKRLTVALGMIFLAAYLQGCASGATVAGMTSTKSMDLAKTTLASKVVVASVEGGKDTNPLWTSQVGSKEFEQALSSSLQSCGLLAGKEEAYTLKPTLKKLKQPIFGLDFTVTADVLYVLTENASGKELLNESISSSYTAGVSDAFIAVKRLRLANEGAIRNNIDALIERLAKITLP